MDTTDAITNLRRMAQQHREEAMRLGALAASIDAAVDALSNIGRCAVRRSGPRRKVALDAGDEILLDTETILDGVMRLLAARERMKAIQLSRRLGVNNPSIHPVLARATHKGVLIKGEDSTYRLASLESFPPRPAGSDDPSPRFKQYRCVICGGDKVQYLGRSFPTSIEMAERDAGPNPCTCSLGQSR